MRSRDEGRARRISLEIEDAKQGGEVPKPTVGFLFLVDERGEPMRGPRLKLAEIAGLVGHSPTTHGVAGRRRFGSGEDRNSRLCSRWWS